MGHIITERPLGQELIEADEATLTQENKILRFFSMAGADAVYTPTQIRKEVFKNKIGEPSVARAISILRGEGLLERTGEHVKKHTGRPEFYLKLVSFNNTPKMDLLQLLDGVANV